MFGDIEVDLQFSNQVDFQLKEFFITQLPGAAVKNQTGVRWSRTRESTNRSIMWNFGATEVDRIDCVESIRLISGQMSKRPNGADNN